MKEAIWKEEESKGGCHERDISFCHPPPLLHYLLAHCDEALAPGISLGSPTGSPPGDLGIE